MTTRFIALAAALLLLSWLLVPAAGSAPAPAPADRVLVLYSDERLLPANVVGDEVIRRTFAAKPGSRIEFYSEFLDVARFPGDEQKRRQRDFLREKYRDRPPDLVIAGGGPALEFLVEYRAELFTGVPIVHAAVSAERLPAMRLDAKIAGNPVVRAPADTLRLALRLHPDTKMVAVVSGTLSSEHTLAEALRREAAAFGNRVQFRWLTNLSMTNLRSQLAHLPDHSVVLYLTIYRDADGTSYTPQLALSTFASASRAPIYGFYDTYLGHGIVGGEMITFEELARKAAQLAMRILAGEEPQSAARSETHVAVPMFDAREVKRWNISEKDLPPGSVLQFEDPSFWELHRRLILATISVVAIETLLIGALFAQLRRRRRAEASLRKSEETVQLAADSAGTGLWSANPAGGKMWLTERTRLLFGFAPDETPNWDRLRGAIHPDDRASVERAVAESIATGRPFYAEFRVGDGNGSARWILSRGHPHLERNGKPDTLMGASVDITERKRAEEERRRHAEELIHLSRVNLAGELSGSIVHEISQPLGAILANTETAELHCAQTAPDMAEVLAILADIRHDSLRAGEIVHGMRTFLRRHPMELQPLDLRTLLAEVDKLAGADAALRQTKLEFQTSSELPTIRGHRRQLQQVLLNLILNGLQAMEECPVEERRVLVTTDSAPEDKVAISVVDRGHGIPPDKLDQVFTPFLTTKVAGLGLGLSICRRIIEAHGGSISIANNHERGATVRFVLPTLTT